METEDKEMFKMAKQKLEVDKYDIKGAFVEKFHTEYIEPEVSHLQILDKVFSP
jgi:hypothetical protein